MGNTCCCKPKVYDPEKDAGDLPRHSASSTDSFERWELSYPF